MTDLWVRAAIKIGRAMAGPLLGYPPVCLLAGCLSFTWEIAFPVKRSPVATDSFPLQLEFQPAAVDFYILPFR